MEGCKATFNGGGSDEHRDGTARTIIIIAKKSDPNGVYHGFRYPYSVKKENASEIGVTWTKDGIKIITRNGFGIIVPKERFIEGR